MGDDIGSLCKCFAVLDLALAAKAGTICIRALRGAIDGHFKAHQKAYGKEGWKPKFHLALRAPDQIEDISGVLDCFVVESAHLLPKLASTSLDNL
eukprot:7472760-Pyramimonas_sp.AAC.1